MIAGTETQIKTQHFNSEIKQIELQFANVPVGSSASIVIEVYTTEGSPKFVIFKGRGEIKSIKEGGNAVSIKMGDASLDTAIYIAKENTPLDYFPLDNSDELYCIDAVRSSVLKISLYKPDKPCEYSFDGTTWQTLTTDEQVDIL